MKLFKLLIVPSLLISLASCDKGKVCECTSTFSDGSADVINTYETLDKTNNPDCSPYEVTVDNSGVTSTTTCEAVRS
jgi:hypothetical protein